MKPTDQEFARQFKSEADELWFGDVHFDEVLKQKVRDRISGSRRKYGSRIRKMGLTAFSLIAVAALLIVVVPLLSPEREAPGTTAATNLDASGGIEAATPFNKEEMAIDTTAADEGVSWIPASVGQAGEAFGDGFALPGWVPKGFSVREVSAFGPREGVATSVTIVYMSDDRTFWLTERRTERPEIVPFRQTIDINGIVGYLNAASPPERTQAEADNASSGETSGTAPAAPFPTAELYWHVSGVQYEIHGSITGEEAVEIARSIVSGSTDNESHSARR